MWESLYHYLTSVSLREPELFAELRRIAMAESQVDLQISPEQGQFMALLVELTQAKRGIEVGTFAGYSTLWLASVLPDDGLLITCDIDDRLSALAKEYWRKANLHHKIEQRIAPAVQTLDELLAKSNEVGSYDFVFIDADKMNYPIYYEKALRLIRQGGLIMIDNIFFHGKVLEAADKQGAVINKLNKQLHNDARVHISSVPLRDGLTLLRKVQPAKV